MNVHLIYKQDWNDDTSRKPERWASKSAYPAWNPTNTSRLEELEFRE